MKKMRKFLPIMALALVVAGFAAMNYVVEAEENQTNTIPGRVYIGDIAIGGMTEAEAEVAVEESVAAMMNAEFTLNAGENSATVTASELGVSWTNTHVVEEAMGIGKTGNLIERYKARKDLEVEDKVFEIEYGIDKELTNEWLVEHAPQLDQEAIDSTLKREDGGFKIIDGQSGIAIDVAASVQNIADYFTDGWTGEGATIALTADVVEPRGTKEELAKVKDLLGDYATDFSDSGAGRVVNVQNAAGKVDGNVIYPGEEFSVYGAIGPLDASNGYQNAPSYENGTTVDSIGGGVCQISSTLYNAVIKAELEITERSNHSMLVSYVKPSMDAAIAGTYKDLKFKNNTDAPIYIEGYTSGRTLHFNIFGHETRDTEHRKVEYLSDVLNTEDPITKFEATGDAIGYKEVTQKAHIGTVAQLWKIVIIDGQEVSKEIFNKSTYKASPKIVAIGTASASAEAMAAINEALATQDEATIMGTIDYWNDAAIAARAAEAANAQTQENNNSEEPDEGDSKKNNPEKDDPKKEDEDDSESDNE